MIRSLFLTTAVSSVALFAAMGNAQQVLLNGVPVAGSPNVVNQVAVPDLGTLVVDPGASIITNLDAVIDAVNGTTITVLNRGTITSTGNRGINAVDSTLFLTNSGTITGNFQGVEALTITNLTNTGTITGSFEGVVAFTITNLTNTGTITSNNREGVDALTITNLTNAGTIRGDDEGVRASGVITNLTNTGTIRGGDDGVGAFAITNLTNSGTIRSDDNGVAAFTITNLTNTGTIRGDSDGVEANTITNLTNSGTIIGNGGTAIREAGAANTLLTLLPGSNIQGLVDLGGGVNTLVVGNGLNMATTFLTVPQVIATNGAPFVVNGNQVIVIDPSGLATARTWLDSLSVAILNAVSGSSAGAGGTDTAGFAIGDDGTRIAPVAATDATGTGMRAWGTAFGGGRDQEGSGPTVDANVNYGGMIVGAEGIHAGDMRLGFFLGGSLADIHVQFGAQNVGVDSVFGGVYARRDWADSWIKLIVAGGWADHEARRTVANNLVAGGLETARADYDGFFITPSVTLGTRLHGVVPGHVLVPSIRVNYSGLFLDGYTESGVTNPLTVSDRDVHLLGTRVQIACRISSMDQTGPSGALRPGLVWMAVSALAATVSPVPLLVCR